MDEASEMEVSVANPYEIGGYNASGEVAISVRNASKSFIKCGLVLENLNLTVQQGSIYSLLGASGSGKTTLLSCVIGTQKLDSGEIKVFGETPGSPKCGVPGVIVGYMPQNLSLNIRLSIRENLTYYGRLYGLTSSEIKERIKFLRNMLDLPDVGRYVHTLSGGQQRRTSLAICLIHEPPLLILDEPTVGVDPLLRQKIWEYIVDLAKTKGSTIVITTHYIEEAGQSDMVGIMKSGRLLVESNPKALLKTYKYDLLEDVVLAIHRNHSQHFKENDTENQNSEETVFSKNKKSEKHPVIGLSFKHLACTDISANSGLSNKSSMFQNIEEITTKAAKKSIGRKIGNLQRIDPIARRKFQISLRNPVLLFAFLILPTTQVMFGHWVLGTEPRQQNFGVVNLETISAENCPKSYDTYLDETCQTQDLSCSFINRLLAHEVNVIDVNSKEEALKEVQLGNLHGYLQIPENFTASLLNLVTFGNFADNETISHATILARLDLSDFVGTQFLKKALLESYLSFAKSSMEKCNVSSTRLQVPLKFNKPVYGTLEPKFQDFIDPGMALVMIHAASVLMSAFYELEDRSDGTTERSIVAGAKFMDIFVASSIVQGFYVAVQILVTYIVGVVLLGMQAVQGSFLPYFAVTTAVSISGLSIGFISAQIFDTTYEAILFSSQYFGLILTFSGLLWPEEGSPLICRFIKNLFPFGWPLIGIRSVLNRGWPVDHPLVWPSFAISLVWILITWPIAIRFARVR